MPGPSKGSPAAVKAGQRGASRRWGPPRVIRLDDLPAEQRSFIVELVAVARRNAPQAAASGTE
jgi:hypothetical protein